MNKPVIGILGAGKLGVVIAQLTVKAGYAVYIAGSGDPEKIALTVKVITPGAIAVSGMQAITKADIVILALPLSKYKNLDVSALKNKLVIDAMNYWWEVDGDMPDLQLSDSSSEMVQDFLTSSRVVKAFSHIGYHNLLDDARPKGTRDRKAMAIAGNNIADNTSISQLVDGIGFDPVVIGDLSTSQLLEPGNPLFGSSVTKDEILKLKKKKT